MPDKKRYFYRSVALNQLDSGAVDMGREKIPSGDAIIDVPGVDPNRILNNRRVRLVQRWAEALQEGEQAPILPHIRNLSHEMEADNVQTYELVLCSKLFARDLVEIDREQRFYPHSRILGIGALLDIPVIAGRVAKLAGTVDQVVMDDDQWGSLDDVLSGKVFAWQKEPQVDSLRAVYARMADTAFIDPESMSLLEQDEVFAQVREAVLDVLKSNVWLFPEGSEKGWFRKNLRNKLDTMDMAELFAMVVGDRRNNILQGNIPREFDPGSDVDRRKLVRHRLYSRLLVEFLRLFFDEKGGRHPEWIKAVNYFIWLGYYRDVLGICDYFVLHAPNLQQQCSMLFEGSAPPLPASGMILSSSERLPLSMREECEELFRTIVSPVEELSFAHVNHNESKALGFQKGEYMISHEVDTPIGILNLERDRLSSEGKMATDYLEMWRRFVKRDWSDALPEALDELFHHEGRLFEMGFRFGYSRALRRSQVPKRVVNGRLEFWPFSDLLHGTDRWLDVSVELPNDLLSPRAGWVFQVKTWLLFFAIASCQHVIKYAFKGMGRLDNWETGDGVRRARLRVRWRRVDQYTQVIEVVNSGDELPPEYPCHTDVIRPIGSSAFGRIDLPVPQRDRDGGIANVVTIHPSRKVLDPETGSITWVAEIVITDTGRSDHG